MIVSNYMTPDPTSVHPGTPVKEAFEIMQGGGFHQMPVVDEENQLLGIVTDRDIRSGVAYDASAYAQLLVEDIMTSDPITIDQRGSIEEAIGILCAHRFGALPVVKGRQLVGIISIHDLVGVLQCLLGLNREGGRLEVAIPHGTEDIIRVLDQVPDKEELLSLVAAPLDPQSLDPVLYIRTRSNDPEPLHKLLKAHGLVVLGVRPQQGCVSG